MPKSQKPAPAEQRPQKRRARRNMGWSRPTARYVRIPITDYLSDALEMLPIKDDRGPYGAAGGERRILTMAMEEAILAVVEAHMRQPVTQWPWRFELVPAEPHYRGFEWCSRYREAERILDAAEAEG